MVPTRLLTPLLRRLTFWWSNVLQLRWSFWELCRGQGLGAAAAGASLPPRRNGSRQEGLEVQGSGTVSPRAALAAAAAARSAAASGLEWMLVLLPQLQDLEGWLFAQMLRHLWWRVLLQGVAQQPGGGDAAAGGGGSSSARSARTGAPLTKAVSATSDQFSPGTQQGTPRSFETPEVRARGGKLRVRALRARCALQRPANMVPLCLTSPFSPSPCFLQLLPAPQEEAVHRWVCGLRGVERALKDSSRPAPAPRAHLALLHRQLITALLRRLDTLLFRCSACGHVSAQGRVVALCAPVKIAFYASCRCAVIPPRPCCASLCNAQSTALLYLLHIAALAGSCWPTRAIRHATRCACRQ